ncbi:MAG: hypothetical protein SOH68_03580 [Lactobacillus sp.]|jgi:hypothetical protein
MERYEFDPKVRENYESLSIPIAIYQTGPEGRELLLVSDGLCQMLGQSRSQLMQGAIASDLSCLPALLERKRELKAAESGLIMVEYADLTKQQERLFLTDQAYLSCLIQPWAAIQRAKTFCRSLKLKRKPMAA